MALTRRDFLAYGSAATALAWPWNAGTSAGEPASLPFLVVGDWGKPDHARDAARVAGQMAREANEADVRFVISTGDNFYNRGVTGLDDPLWLSAFEDIYSDPALQVPWYVVLGNHDYGGTPDAELAYALRSDRWNLPARYYVLEQELEDGTRADFFFLDTTMLVNVNFVNQWFAAGVDAGNQIAWLKAMLAASTAEWKIVVGHHPIYSGGEHGDTQVLIETVLPALKRYGVQAYINGHDHDLEHIERDGIHFLTSGGGASFRTVSAVEGTQFVAPSRGFLSARLARTEMRIAFISDEGDLLHSGVLHRTSSP